MVTQRRIELRLDAAELARAADVDPKTLASLEKGERWPRDKSRSRIEQALHWSTGSLSTIRAGGQPSVSGIIRGRSGRTIQEFKAIEGGEQETLRLLRLASIILDARDLVRSHRGPLMTALTSVLDEAAELVVGVVAGEDGDTENAQWFIDEARAGNSIRRKGDIYVVDDHALDVSLPSAKSPGRGLGTEPGVPTQLTPAAERLLGPGEERDRAEQGGAADLTSNDAELEDRPPDAKGPSPDGAEASSVSDLQATVDASIAEAVEGEVDDDDHGRKQSG